MTELSDEKKQARPDSGRAFFKPGRIKLPTAKAHLIFWPVSILGFVLDLFTKWIAFEHIEPGQSIPVIDGVVQLVRVLNAGAAFGVLAGKTNYLIFVSIAAFLIVLGLFLSLILGIGLGVTGYLTLPYLYRDLTEPAADNARRIHTLERDLQDARAEAQASDQTREDRLAGFEALLTEQANALAGLEEQLGELASEQPNQARFTRTLSALEKRVEEHADGLDDLESRLGEVEGTLAEDKTPLDRVQRDLLLTRAMVSVMRARLWLLENNLGSATFEVQNAQELVQEVIGATSEEDVPSVQAVADRLELTLVCGQLLLPVLGPCLSVRRRLGCAPHASLQGHGRVSRIRRQSAHPTMDCRPLCSEPLTSHCPFAHWPQA